jgi:hypothetical protein
MVKLGPYSKEIVLGHVDHRTREGRLLLQMRRALADHLGGERKVNAVQRALIERASWLQLRCATLDERIIDGTFSDYDNKSYLAFANALRRTLVALGVEKADDKPSTLAEAMERARAAREAREQAAP